MFTGQAREQRPQPVQPVCPIRSGMYENLCSTRWRQPGALHRTRVMSRRMQREKREAARIPAAHPPAGRPARILLNVETGAGRTDGTRRPRSRDNARTARCQTGLSNARSRFLAELSRIETLFRRGPDTPSFEMPSAGVNSDDASAASRSPFGVNTSTSAPPSGSNVS